MQKAPLSYGNWNYERSGSDLKTEDDRFDPTPPANQSKTLDAIVYLERAVVGATALEGFAPASRQPLRARHRLRPRRRSGQARAQAPVPDRRQPALAHELDQ